MKLKFKLLPLLCFLAASAGAQSVPFLGIGPDARSAGMGGIGTATSADAWSIYWNGAKTLFSTERGAASYSYFPDVNDRPMHSVGGYYKWDEKSAFTAGFRHVSGTSVYNDSPTKPRDYALDLGYSRLLMEGLAVGAAVRYIGSDMDVPDTERGDAVAFDLSAYYRRTLTVLGKESVLAVGVNAANFGSKISYGGPKNALPARIDGGVSLEAPLHENHSILGSAQYGYRFAPDDSKAYDVAVGAEYRCYKIAAIRAGFHWGDPDVGEFNYFAFGGGINYHHIQADFSYRVAVESTDILDKMVRFSLGMDFGLFGIGGNK